MAMTEETLCLGASASNLSFRERLLSKANKPRKPKLVWARFGLIWWPAMLFPSLKEFDAEVRSRLSTDPVSYNAFQLHLQALVHFNKGVNHSAILFLGRSLHDFRIVRGAKNTGKQHYQCFLSCRKLTKLVHESVVCNPEAFGTNKRDYFAFHVGLDEAMKRTGEREGSRLSYSKQAFNAWDGF